MGLGRPSSRCDLRSERGPNRSEPGREAHAASHYDRPSQWPPENETTDLLPGWRKSGAAGVARRPCEGPGRVPQPGGAERGIDKPGIGMAVGGNVVKGGLGVAQKMNWLGHAGPSWVDLRVGAIRPFQGDQE